MDLQKGETEMAKVRRKRMRRAYLLRYSNGYIPAPSRDDAPRRNLPAKDGDKTGAFSDTVRYYDRIKSIALEISLPLTATLNEPRAEALERAKTIAVEQFIPVVLRGGRSERLVMMCGGPGGETYFIYSHRSGIFKESIRYRSRDSAMEKYQRNKVTWIEVKSLPPATL